MRAIWNNAVLAQSPDTKVVEGNHYFPPGSMRMEFLRKSGNTYTCPWKGVCDYYDVIVDGQVNADAAWVYEQPTDAAKEIAGYYAFWKGIKIMP